MREMIILRIDGKKWPRIVVFLCFILFLAKQKPRPLHNEKTGFICSSDVLSLVKGMKQLGLISTKIWRCVKDADIYRYDIWNNATDG